MDLGPLTATSLNRTGEEPAATRLDAERLCGGAHDAPLLIFADGLDATGEAPSTVVDCASDLPRILREGGLAAEEVEPYLAS
jgi:tRNA A37 threonylcarbamoyladenosine synthetase subunit TsaC/SUA5/YrdC